MVGPRRQAGVDRVGQLAGQVGAQATQAAGAAADRPRGGGGVGAAVRVLAAPALVEHQRQRVDVGLGAGRPALGLLRRHVGEGADDVSRGGQGRPVGEPGDPEVHQLGPLFAVAVALGHLDVLGLDVAVDDAARVGVVERLAEIGADLSDLAVAELAGAGKPRQRRALDQLGDQQGVAVLLAHLVERDDARMVEPGGGLRLAQHAATGLATLLDRLDRHRPLESAVPGLVDNAEAAAADAALDEEAVEDQRTDQSPYDFGVSAVPPALGQAGKTAPFAAALDAPTSSGFILFGQPTSLESASLESSRAPAPRRRERPPRRPERQQIMLRRGLALGGGLLLLILIVLGVKGCLDARAHRALSDYSRNVTQIVEETDQTSKDFFGKLTEPGGLSVTDFVGEIDADRSAMDNYASRVDALSAPGDMGNAQNALELIYELRSSAMTEIADKMSTALGDAGSAKAMAAIAKQMQKLLAADVVYANVVRPEIDGVLASNGIEGDDVPESVFLPEGTKWLEESAVSAALGAVSGTTSGEVTGGVHGLGLSGVSVNGTELGEEAATVCHGRNRRKSKSTVENQGESTENGVTVSVSVDGKPVRRKHPDASAPAETGTVSIPLTPTPSGEATLEVEVETVPGEQVSENNEASYTVNFE